MPASPLVTAQRGVLEVRPAYPQARAAQIKYWPL